MDKKRLEDIVSVFPGLKIAVIGDMLLDQYWQGDSVEVSRESLGPYVTGNKIVYSPGAAGNTVYNVTMLGAEVFPVSVIGRQEDGDKFCLELIKQFHNKSIDTSYLLKSNERATESYLKIHSSSHGRGDYQVGVYKYVNGKPLTENDESNLISYLAELKDKIDGLIITDQAEASETFTGILTPKIINSIRELYKDKLVVVDSRNRIALYSDCVVKVNDHEAKMAEKPDISVEQAGKKLLERNKAVVVTCGDEGSLVFEKNNEPHRILTSKITNADVTGAGDTYSAWFTLSKLAGATIKEAVQIAHLACHYTVQQFGTTGWPTREHVLENYEKLKDEPWLGQL